MLFCLQSATEKINFRLKKTRPCFAKINHPRETKNQHNDEYKTIASFKSKGQSPNINEIAVLNKNENTIEK